MTAAVATLPASMLLRGFFTISDHGKRQRGILTMHGQTIFGVDGLLASP